jgi:hypothetical protein
MSDIQGNSGLDSYEDSAETAGRYPIIPGLSAVHTDFGNQYITMTVEGSWAVKVKPPLPFELTTIPGPDPTCTVICFGFKMASPGQTAKATLTNGSNDFFVSLTVPKMQATQLTVQPS